MNNMPTIEDFTAALIALRDSCIMQPAMCYYAETGELEIRSELNPSHRAGYFTIIQQSQMDNLDRNIGREDLDDADLADLAENGLYTDSINYLAEEIEVARQEAAYMAGDWK